MINLISMFQDSPQVALIYLISSFLACCIAISFHEWAHAFAAYKLGDPTAKNMGRMSLDPMRHIDPIGMILFVVLGIGWAKPVIVNSRNLKNFRRDDVLISLAGPLMNLILSFIFYGLYSVGLNIYAGAITSGAVSSSALLPAAIVQLFYIIFSLNIVLAIFNVLPIPPLDGFHVVSSLFIRKSYRVVEFLQKYGFLILIVLIFSGLISSIISPIISWLAGLYSSFYGLFL